MTLYYMSVDEMWKKLEILIIFWRCRIQTNYGNATDMWLQLKWLHHVEKCPFTLKVIVTEIQYLEKLVKNFIYKTYCIDLEHGGGGWSSRLGMHSIQAECPWRHLVLREHRNGAWGVVCCTDVQQRVVFDFRQIWKGAASWQEKLAAFLNC